MSDTVPQEPFEPPPSGEGTAKQEDFEPPADEESNPQHRETMIESSVVGPVAYPPDVVPPEERGKIPTRFLVTLGIVIVVVVALGFVTVLRAQRLAAALAEFERVLVEATPEEALAASEKLPDALKADPELSVRIAELRERVAARAYLAQIGDVRAGLQRAEGYQARIQVCEQAIKAEVEPLRMKAARTRARFELALMKTERAEEVDAALAQLKREVEEAGLLEADPPWGRYLLARMQWRHRGAKAALGELRQAHVPDARSAVGSLVAGLLAQAEARPQMALSYYGQALSRDPRLVDGHLLRGALRLELGNAKGAHEDAVKARELDPLSAEATRLLAEVHLRRGDRPAARRLLKALLAARPREPFALGLQAYLEATAADAERRKQAGPRASLALKLNPLADWAHLAQAELLRRNQKLDEARAAVKDALSLAKRCEAYLLRARLLLAQGKHGLALQDLMLRVLRIDPPNTEALLLAIRAYAENRQFDRARRLVGRMQQVRESAAGYCWTGRLLLADGYRADPKQAVDALTQAIALDGKLAAAYAYRALAYVRQRRAVAALADLDRAQQLKLRPEEMPSWEVARLRGTCHEQLGETEKAIQHYQTYLRQGPIGHRHRSRIQLRLRKLQR